MPTNKRARQKALRREKSAQRLRRAKRRKQTRNALFIALAGGVIIALVLVTTSLGKNSSTTTTIPTSAAAKAAANFTRQQAHSDAKAVRAGCPKSTKARTNTLSWSTPPAMAITTNKTYKAVVTTTQGSFTITLLAKTAPNTVNNFIFLAKQGYYNCVTFHRVIPGFMDQTGDPTGTGSGGPGYQFATENLPASYAPWDVAMANSGPNTNGSQFFIVVQGGTKQLQSKYSLFGKVSAGMGTVTRINNEGNSKTNGVPPKVIERILTITITTA